MLSGVTYEHTTAIALFWMAGLATFIIAPCLLMVMYLARRRELRALPYWRTRGLGRRFQSYPVPAPKRRPVRVALSTESVAPLITEHRRHHCYPNC